MYSFLKHFHSGWAYLTIALGLAFFLVLLYYFVTKKENNNALSKFSFYTTLTFHIQMLVGAVLYFFSPITSEVLKGTVEFNMGDATQRLYMLEHPLMMVTAVTLVTLVNLKVKRNNQVKISELVLIILALLAMLAMIPWKVWLS